jgi:ubiquinone/menaquinone biosynthesis C-methylase UbiE
MKFSKTFGRAYDYFMFFLERFFLRKRRVRLLSGLTGRILEVGVGTGINFRHYGKHIELTGIDPSPYMISRAEIRKDKSQYPEKITLLNIGCGSPEMEELIAPGTLDAVVCTLVLCTLPDPEKALKNFMLWLKPGGRLLILEHIRSHHHFSGRIQDFFNPVWKRFGEGCNLNRPTDEMLQNSGFRLVREDRFSIGMPFYEAEYRKP